MAIGVIGTTGVKPMRIFVSNGQADFEGEVADDADLDGTFTLTEDDGECYRINGWQASDIEIIDE